MSVKNTVAPPFSATHAESGRDNGNMEVLQSFMPRVTWHDYRGFRPEWKPEDGSIVGYYPSCNYLWRVFCTHMNKRWKIQLVKWSLYEGKKTEDALILPLKGEWQIPPESPEGEYIISQLPPQKSPE